MATGFENWVTQATTPLQIAVLRSHIAALSASMTREVSQDGTSVSSTSIQSELVSLRAELKDLQTRPDAASSGGVVGFAGFGNEAR